MRNRQVSVPTVLQSFVHNTIPLWQCCGVFLQMKHTIVASASTMAIDEHLMDATDMNSDLCVLHMCCAEFELATLHAFLKVDLLCECELSLSSQFFIN